MKKTTNHIPFGSETEELESLFQSLESKLDSFLKDLKKRKKYRERAVERKKIQNSPRECFRNEMESIPSVGNI